MRFKQGQFTVYEARFWLLAEAPPAEGGGGPGDPPPADAEGGGDGAPVVAPPPADAAPGDKPPVEGKPSAEPTWRDSIKDPEALKLAKDSTDVEHLAKRALEMRQKLAKAVIIPGKDSSEEDIAAYRKTIGVPESAAGYEFPALPEDDESIDVEAVTASRKEWADTFMEFNIPKSTATALMGKLQAEMIEAQAKVLEADTAYAEAQDNELKKAWGTEYETNKKLANQAVTAILGADFEEAKHIEDKHGKFVLDNPIIIKAFARLGKEMDTGTLGPVVDGGQRETMQEQARALRNKANEAAARGDSKAANAYSNQERAIYEKLDGSQPVVGAEGRSL